MIDNYQIAFEKLVEIIESWREDAIDSIKDGREIINNAHVVSVLTILIHRIRYIEEGRD